MKQAFLFLSIIFICIMLVIVALIFNDPAATVEKYRAEMAQREGKASNSSNALFPSKIDININVNIQMDANTAQALNAFSRSGNTSENKILNTTIDSQPSKENPPVKEPTPSSVHRHPDPSIFVPINPHAEKTLMLAISQEPDSLDPIFQEMSASKEFYGHMFRQLTAIDHNWNVFPELALEVPTIENGLWEVFENGKMRTTFHLRDLKWSDGHPLTADDFLFTYEVVMDKLQPVVTRDVYEKIEKMESENEGRTLVITWKKHYAYAVEDDIWVVPQHLLEPIYRKDPVNYNIHPKVAREPVGNGPYRLKEWVSGSHIILEKNPYWYGKEPHFEKLIYQIVGDTSILEDKLVYNEIQMISPIGLSMDQALRLERSHGKKVNVYMKSGLVWEHIDCNLDSPILKDVRVRQALMYGMDRDTLVSVLFENRQKVAHSWLPSKHYGYHPEIKQYSLNPEKAGQLLDEAGWRLVDASGKPYSDRIRRNSEGEKLEIIIMTTTGNKVREEVEIKLQGQWKKIGVELLIKNENPKVFFGETTSKRRYPHLAMYAWTMSHFSDGESLWTIKNIPSEENGWQGQNYPGWYNEEANALDLQVSSTLDRELRIELLRRQQELWVEDVPSLPLYFRSDIMAAHKDLVNIYLTGAISPVSWNSEYWGYREK